MAPEMVIGFNSLFLLLALDLGQAGGSKFSRSTLATLPREKPVPASRAAKSAFGGLTEREREIVVCIAQGKSNREIAEALIVTKRTVETHINNILYKLDCTSRSQIVAWASEKGLLN